MPNLQIPIPAVLKKLSPDVVLLHKACGQGAAIGTLISALFLLAMAGATNSHTLSVVTAKYGLCVLAAAPVTYVAGMYGTILCGLGIVGTVLYAAITGAMLVF